MVENATAAIGQLQGSPHAVDIGGQACKQGGTRRLQQLDALLQRYLHGHRSTVRSGSTAHRLQGQAESLLGFVALGVE